MLMLMRISLGEGPVQGWCPNPSLYNPLPRSAWLADHLKMMDLAVVLAVLVVGSHAVPVVIVTSNSTGQGCSAIDAGIWASRQAQFLSDVKVLPVSCSHECFLSHLQECGEGCTSERHCTADCMHKEHDYTIACAVGSISWWSFDFDRSFVTALYGRYGLLR